MLNGSANEIAITAVIRPTTKNNQQLNIFHRMSVKYKLKNPSSLILISTFFLLKPEMQDKHHSLN